VKEGWEKFLLEVRTRRRTRMTKCQECRIQSLCGMCPANGELEAGDKETPVAFLCEVAHLRALSLGLEVPAHGDCEFCAGGAEQARVREAARRIASADIDGEPCVEPDSPFAILNQATPRTACSSCGGH
jgi:hypothetical protein